MAVLVVPLVLLVVASALAVRDQRTAPFAGFSWGSLMLFAGLVTVLLLVVGLAFLWALAVWSCHGGYECPV